MAFLAGNYVLIEAEAVFSSYVSFRAHKGLIFGVVVVLGFVWVGFAMFL